MKPFLAVYLVGVILTALWLMRAIKDRDDKKVPSRFYVVGSLFIALIWPLAVIEAVYQIIRDRNE